MNLVIFILIDVFKIKFSKQLQECAQLIDEVFPSIFRAFMNVFRSIFPLKRRSLQKITKDKEFRRLFYVKQNKNQEATISLLIALLASLNNTSMICRPIKQMLTYLIIQYRLKQKFKQQTIKQIGEPKSCPENSNFFTIRIMDYRYIERTNCIFSENKTRKRHETAAKKDKSRV